MKLRQITPEFVDEIPRELEPGKLYVCCRYRAVMHLCACGCGASISTPLHPTGWTLTCHGVSVSLWPSIGNWSEKCQSHYWIRNSNIHWAPQWSRHKILKTRKARDLELDRYFSADSPILKRVNLFRRGSVFPCPCEAGSHDSSTGFCAANRVFVALVAETASMRARVAEATRSAITSFCFGRVTPWNNDGDLGRLPSRKWGVLLQQ